MKTATLYDYARMCRTYDTCHCCPLSHCNNGLNQVCGDLARQHPDKANEIILKWCEERPVKTTQDRFLKIFPNAKIDNCGTLILCPRWVDKDFKCNRKRLSCDACEKEYWLAEVDEHE